MQIEALREWAYRTLYYPAPRPARVEVGTELLEALKATAVPLREEDEEDAPPFVPTPHHTLLGVPLTEDQELPATGWRTLDWHGQQLAAGSGL